MSRRGFGIIVFLLFVDTKPYQPCKVLRRNDADLQMKVSCLSQALEEIPSQYRNEHVVELDVSLNKITSLENSSFAGYDDVKIVKLDNNEIYTIADDAFRYLKKLITVSLAGNNLTSITPDLFADCSSLKTLILKGNNFNHLSLQQHSFLVSSTLASLDLSFCQLEQLPATFFSETPKLAIIDVGHNYLKSIRPETFQWLKHLTYVKLKGNPLQCTCELRETLSRFQERNISVRPAAMQCSLGSEKVKLASFISGNSCQAEVTRQQTSEVPVPTEQPSTTEYSQRIVASQKSRHTETAPPDDADKTSTTENDPVKENSEEDSAALSQKNDVSSYLSLSYYSVRPELLGEIATRWAREGYRTDEAFDFLWKLKREGFFRDYYNTEQDAQVDIEKLLPVAERLGFQETARQALRLNSVLTDELLLALTYDTAAMIIDVYNMAPGAVSAEETLFQIRQNMAEMFVATADFQSWQEDDPGRLHSMLVKHALRRGSFTHHSVPQCLANLVNYRFDDGLPTDRVIVDVLLHFPTAFDDEQEHHVAMLCTKQFIGSIYHAGGRRLADRIYADPRDIVKSYFSNFLESGKCPKHVQEIFQNLLDYLEKIS